MSDASQRRRFVSPALLLAILLCFFMPFFSVSCTAGVGQMKATVTGMDQVVGGKPEYSGFRPPPTAQGTTASAEQNSRVSPSALVGFATIVVGIGVGLGLPRARARWMAGAAMSGIALVAVVVNQVMVHDRAEEALGQVESSFRSQLGNNPIFGRSIPTPCSSSMTSPGSGLSRVLLAVVLAYNVYEFVVSETGVERLGSAAEGDGTPQDATTAGREPCRWMAARQPTDDRVARAGTIRSHTHRARLQDPEAVAGAPAPATASDAGLPAEPHLSRRSRRCQQAGHGAEAVRPIVGWYRVTRSCGSGSVTQERVRGGRADEVITLVGLAVKVRGAGMRMEAQRSVRCSPITRSSALRYVLVLLTLLVASTACVGSDAESVRTVTVTVTVAAAPLEAAGPRAAIGVATGASGAGSTAKPAKYVYKVLGNYRATQLRYTASNGDMESVNENGTVTSGSDLPWSGEAAPEPTATRTRSRPRLLARRATATSPASLRTTRATSWPATPVAAPTPAATPAPRCSTGCSASDAYGGLRAAAALRRVDTVRGCPSRRATPVVAEGRWSERGIPRGVGGDAQRGSPFSTWRRLRSSGPSLRSPQLPVTLVNCGRRGRW